MARYNCAFRNGSTDKNGKFGPPDKCKAQNCMGVWRKYPPKCEDFIPDVPTIMLIMEKKALQKVLKNVQERKNNI